MLSATLVTKEKVVTQVVINILVDKIWNMYIVPFLKQGGE